MTKKKAKGKGKAGGAPEGQAELENTQNLTKIREILFGSQSREVDLRFAEFEARLTRELDTVREEYAQELEALKELVQSGLDSLSGQLTALLKAQDELEERTHDALKKATQEVQEQLQGELQASFAELEQRGRQLGERVDGAQRKLREELLEECRELRSEQQAATRALSQDLSDETQRLREAKLGRADLATLLSELVRSLNEDAEA